MNIKPKKRIVATIRYPTNPRGIEVCVSDDEAREAVNKLSGKPWIAECNSPVIIKHDSVRGFFVMNPCFDLADVIAVIEGALL